MLVTKRATSSPDSPILLTPQLEQCYATLKPFVCHYPIPKRLLMARMQVLNTKGAAKRLGCSLTWIHRLVSTGKLKAYVYDDNGRLVERKPDEKRQGQAMSFRVKDVDAYQPAVQRRPRGSKNKPPRLYEQPHGMRNEIIASRLRSTKWLHKQSRSNLFLAGTIAEIPLHCGTRGYKKKAVKPLCLRCTSRPSFCQMTHFGSNPCRIPLQSVSLQHQTPQCPLCSSWFFVTWEASPRACCNTG